MDPSRPGRSDQPLGGLFRAAADAFGSFIDELATDEPASHEPPRLDPSGFTAATGRMNIRPPSPSDRRALERIYRDPDNRAAHGWSDETVTELVRNLRTRSSFEQLMRHSLVGVRRDTFEITGLATLQRHPHPENQGALSIGLSTLPQHRAQGFAIELLAAMITAAQALISTSTGRHRSLWVGTETTNETVQRMLSSLGYEADVSTETYTAPDGTTMDSYWYNVGQTPPRFTPRPNDDPLP